VGTGGGRLAFELQARGVHRITGIDISERLVAAARARALRLGAGIEFDVQDVADLHYADGSFDVVCALEQVLCQFERAEDFRRALAHIHRVLVPGGRLYLSVLSWEGRRANPLIAAAAAPFKWLKGDRHASSRYHLPLLRVAGRFNTRYAWQRQPHVVFFTRERFERELRAAQFEILDLASTRMLAEGGDAFAPGGFLFAMARRATKATG
jgi:SAM-dependent methyltransferase